MLCNTLMGQGARKVSRFLAPQFPPRAYALVFMLLTGVLFMSGSLLAQVPTRSGETVYMPTCAGNQATATVQMNTDFIDQCSCVLGATVSQDGWAMTISGTGAICLPQSGEIEVAEIVVLDKYGAFHSAWRVVADEGSVTVDLVDE